MAIDKLQVKLLVVGGAVSSVISGAMSAASDLIGGALSGGKSSTVGDTLGGIPIIGGILGGGVNALIGSKLNEQAILDFKNQNQELLNRLFAASNNSDLLSQSLFGFLGNISKGEVGSDGVFSNKAGKITKLLNMQRLIANVAALTGFNNEVNNLDLLNDLSRLANIAAYGGPLTMRYSGFMSPFGNRFREGGRIYIKPSKRGTFTAAAKKHGKSVQAFASQVLANKDNYSSAMVKKANFARNAAKWHAAGGPLYTQGGIWDNGLTYINEGNTHELNPYEGVLIGIDELGVPNLVEEGEVVFNDYVFSNRLKVPKNIRLKYRLKDNITFADASKKLSKESEERPNDPISKNGLDAILSELAMTQEAMRELKNMRELNKYARGGKLGKLYDGTGVWTNFLNLPNSTNPNLGFFSKSYTSPTPTIGKTGIPESWLPYGNTTKSINVFKGEKTEKTGKGKNYWTGLKYLPLGASLGLVLSDAAGITNKPDYSLALALADATIRNTNFTPIKARTVNNYLTYNPEDINYLLAKISLHSAANRRSLLNQSAGNRAAALNSLLAQNYIDQLSVGESIRALQKANRELYENVLKYNNDLERTNNAAAFEAAKANQAALMKANEARLNGLALSFALIRREQEASEAAKAANMNNFLSNVTNFAKDELSLRDRDFALSTGLFGTIPLDMVEQYYGKRAADAVAKKRKESE